MKIRVPAAALAVTALAAVAGATPAWASEPGAAPVRTEFDSAFPRWRGAASSPPGLRPARRVTGGPGYVGSEWGLGKPSYYGIGTRPDWGRDSTD
ncbi:hypothetical protein [Enterovirga sp.]|jgi:hypothetical protein|uniref:hypothetical protein n=1 Tax=Enterovirga sp. TaxID=2026350 RepID=UPI00262D65E3|nr:hypothetical protein [Enterovirga sp.]MDB5591697.1 hypothetical protein [Enterovirga sp.]